jgi:hypothetical protein
MTVTYILLGFLACAAAMLALGISAVRILKLPLNRLECLCLGYAIGAPLASTLALALASLFVARRGVFFGIGILSAALLWRQLPWLRGLKPAALDSIPALFKVLLPLAWVVYGFLYFRFALSPEMSFDGMAYHLGLVNLWNHAHGLLRLKDMFAALPSGMEMLFLFAFAIGRHSAAALVHFSFLMLLPALMVLYGVRFGLPRGSAAFAAIVVFATPLVGWDGSVAYNDVALAVVGLAAVYFLQIWRDDRLPANLAAACVLAGFALAIKYTGCFVCVFVAATVAWELRRGSRARLAGTLCAAAALCAVIPAPYIVRNCIWFQNPIAFFGNSIFRNPYFHVSFERNLVQNLAHLDGVKWRDLPLELTIGGPILHESLGPMYLLAPAALLGLLWPKSRFLALAALALGLGYPGNKSARFLIPILPLLLLAVGCAIGRLPRAGVFALGALSIAQLILCWPPVINRIHTPHGKRAFPSSWKVALRMEPEDVYLRREQDDESDYYVMARFVESDTPPGETVLSLGGGVAQSYTSRPILDSFHSADAERAVDLFYGNADSPKFGGRTWYTAFPALRARQLQVLQSGRSKNPDVMWCIDEIRLWSGGARILPDRSWRLDAFPNPWDIGFAFDGVEGTRWKSWEPMAPGMSVGIRFETPQSIDRIEVDSLDGQWDSQLSLRILTDDGQWRQRSGVWKVNQPLDARKNATRELKREGIHFVVAPDNPNVDRALTNDPTVWGMRAVASSREATLYRIE